jgi:predicted nucleic acid-binding Zn ribbon protein
LTTIYGGAVSLSTKTGAGAAGLSATLRYAGMVTGPSSAALAQPHDTCIRCGRPTPLGVALCDDDNPGRIKGPSATQVHGTIVVGLIAGFILLFVLLGRFLTPAAGGGLAASIPGYSTLADGTTEIVVRVTNTSSAAAAASCRVQRGGAVGAGDIVFFTEPIPAGETRDFTRIMPAPVAGSSGSGFAPGTFAVRCN